MSDQVCWSVDEHDEDGNPRKYVRHGGKGHASVFASNDVPGSWIACGTELSRRRLSLNDRRYGTAEAAMQAVDAADKAKERDIEDHTVDAMAYVQAERASAAYPEQHIKNYTDDNPKTMYGDRKPPIHLVPPVALIAEAGVFKLGARKYGPYNWREKTVSSSVYQGAALRHLLAWGDGEENDPESGESHLAHARACLGILLDAAANGKLNDDRPVAGAAAKAIKDAEEQE